MDMESWIEIVGGEEKLLDHSHPCCKVWRSRDGIIHLGNHKPPRFAWAESGSTVTSDASSVTTGAVEPVSEETPKEYTCPRGHSFSTASPIIIAVDNDPDYNTGPVCGYCYVDWFKSNLNADESRIET